MVVDPMTPRRSRTLETLTHSRRFLWQLAAALLGLGLLASWLASGRAPQPEFSLRERLFHSAADPMGPEVLATLAEAADRSRSDAWPLLEAMPAVAGLLPEDRWPEVEQLLSSRFGDDAARVGRDLLDNASRPNGPARSRLEASARQTPPIRYANRALAHFSLQDGLFLDAARRFAREGSSFPEASEERRLAVFHFLRADDLNALRLLREDPLFRDALGHRALLRLGIDERDWLAVGKNLAFHQIANAQVGTAMIALIGAAAWAAVLWRLARPRHGKAGLAALCVAGLLLGAISTVPTLLLDAMMRAYFDFEMKGDFLHDLGFFIVSVGLREEFCKLLFLLPLAPWLIKRGSEMEMLLVASFVGLGFAAEENAGYFQSATAAVGPGRFLTANFFHLAMTGLCGLYLLRAIGRIGASYSDFFYVFGIVVLAHGVYDAFLVLPEFSDFSLFAFSIFIVLSQRYFVEARSLADAGNIPVSSSAVFIFGMCVFISSVLIFLAAQSDLPSAVSESVAGLVGVAVITVMFFREFRDTLAA